MKQECGLPLTASNDPFNFTLQSARARSSLSITSSIRGDDQCGDEGEDAVPQGLGLGPEVGCLSEPDGDEETLKEPANVCMRVRW